MPISISTVFLCTVCLMFAVLYVIASSQSGFVLSAAAKALASTSFLVLVLIEGAFSSVYGRLIMGGLVLSWFGDMLLLSRERTFLLAGIAAFLLAHISYAAAFAVNELSWPAFAAGLATSGVFAFFVLRWLWKYLTGFYRIAVPLYLAAILLMVSLAAAASAVSLPVSVVIGAAAFAVSDISVAQNRFVGPTGLARAWGLPLYYTAQLLLACSVISQAA